MPRPQVDGSRGTSVKSLCLCFCTHIVGLAMLSPSSGGGGLKGHRGLAQANSLTVLHPTLSLWALSSVFVENVQGCLK